MQRIVALAVLSLLVGLARADNCRPESLVLYRDQPFHLRLLSHGIPSKSIAVALHSTDTSTRSMITDSSGVVDFGVLTPGSYWIDVRGWGRLSLLVRPEQGANGAWITWSKPKQSVKPGDRNNVAPNCVMVEVAD